MLKQFLGAALLAAAGAAVINAQDATTVIANAARSMGAEGLGSITYSGTASNVNFTQTPKIGGPFTPTPVTNYTRTLDLNQPALRATGQIPPAFQGAPTTFNQNITPAQAAWTQQLEIWVTPWGFLKGAAANNATVRSQRMNGRTYNVVTWSPPAKSPSGLPYTVVGYINENNEIERVTTAVEHPTQGDLTVDTTYGAYQTFGNLKVPTKITQKRNGYTTFEATITSATANPPNLAALMTPPQGPGGGGGGGGAGGAAPVVETQKLADGVYRITGGYISLAVDMGDHVVVLEGGQSEARGLAIINATKQAIPNKPIRYVMNTHPHGDHTAGLSPFVAEGVTILTHRNNEEYMEKAFRNPRTLAGDTLAKSKRQAKIEAVGDRRVLRGGGRTIELHHVPGVDHTDGMLIAYLPAEKILFTGDFNIPAPGQPLSAQFAPWFAALKQTVDRLKLDYQTFIAVHAPTPDRPVTRADVEALTQGAPS